MWTMKKDQEVLSFIAFLIDSGYPEDSLAMEWSVDDKYQVDLAVIDPDTSKVIALFEVSEEKSKASWNDAAQQLKVYTKALGDDQIPIFVAFSVEGEPPFEVYRLRREVSDEDEIRSIGVSEVPNFSVLKRGKISEAVSKTERRRETTQRNFQIGCWSGALVVLVLLILDFCSVLDITTERLALIGVVAALIIIPFASELSILGIEFKRLTEKKKG